MDNVKEMENSFNHGISVSERKNVVVSGVKKIDKFDEEEFYIETTLGYLIIKGKELELIKLDTYQGNVSLKGKINSVFYADSSTRKEKENSFFNKLFK